MPLGVLPCPEWGERVLKGTLCNRGAAQRKRHGCRVWKWFQRVIGEGEPQKPPTPTKHTHTHTHTHKIKKIS